MVGMVDVGKDFGSVILLCKCCEGMRIVVYIRDIDYI